MQERARQTRARILESATGLFAEKGLNGVTIDEIAMTAGVNKQRIYAYFHSKSQLFEAVLLHVFEHVELFSGKTVEEAEAHPESMTRTVLRGFLNVHRKHPALWRLLAWANLEGPACTDALNMARRRENERLRKIYAKQFGKDAAGFKTWLFTLLAVSCFRFSNELTLTHTLGWDPAKKSFVDTLVREIEAVFQPKTAVPVSNENPEK